MACDLIHYHINTVKLGQIFKQIRIDRGMSVASAARKSGLTYDTIDNFERGRVQDVKFEVVFKLSCIYAMPIEVIVLLMIKDDDIDFADLVLLYDNKEDDSFPASDISSVPSSVPDTVVAAAEAVAAADNPPEPVRTSAENPENVAQLHRHISKLMELLELSMTKG